MKCIRYADDFVVTADKRKTLEEIKRMQTELLGERGLTLSKEKTLITHIKTTFSKIDHILTNQLKHWSYRRHTNKPRKWIKDKYFIKVSNRDWIFGFKYKDCGKDATFPLMKLADILIRRHVKVKCEANPYATAWDTYFLKRKQKRNRLRTPRKGTLSEAISSKGMEEPMEFYKN